MNKAILVIDMPVNCIQCPCLHRYDSNDWCAAACKVVYSPNNRDKCCPLKPAPELQDLWYDDDWVMGYNNCVHEIMGE